MDKEIYELKLSDVYLKSVPIKNHCFLMQVSFALKSKNQYRVTVGWSSPYDELHRHVDY
jgi:hypothetical protein